MRKNFARYIYETLIEVQSKPRVMQKQYIRQKIREYSSYYAQIKHPSFEGYFILPLSKNKKSPHEHCLPGTQDTALHLLAKAGLDEACETVMSTFCTLNQQNHNGFSPLACAAQEGHTNVVTLFVEKYKGHEKTLEKRIISNVIALLKANAVANNEKSGNYIDILLILLKNAFPCSINDCSSLRKVLKNLPPALENEKILEVRFLLDIIEKKFPEETEKAFAEATTRLRMMR